jgi:hypothetical protein
MRKYIGLLALLISSFSWAQGAAGKVGFVGKVGLLGGPPAGPTVVLDSVIGATCSNNFATSATCPVTNAILVGHRAVVVMLSNTAMTTMLPAVSDPSSNTWSCPSPETGANINATVCDAVITTQINAAANITVTWTGSNGMQLAVLDLSSHTGSSGPDSGYTTGFGSATGTSTAPSATTGGSLSATDFVIGWFQFGNVAAFTSYGGGFTGIANASTQNGYNTILAIEWKTQTSGSAATCPITTSNGTSQWGAVCAAYKQ